MVLALNVSVYFCKLLPLHMNGNLPVGIGMHVFAMICDLIWNLGASLFPCECTEGRLLSVRSLRVPQNYEACASVVW
eukprot:UN4709